MTNTITLSSDATEQCVITKISIIETNNMSRIAWETI